jgi:sulfite exporter TauE/SafE
MSTALSAAALLMGLAGAPHCAVMCGAACAGVTNLAGAPVRRARWTFQLGRLAGYSLAGAAVAMAVESFAWLAAQGPMLRPVWTLFHLAVLAWALTLLALGRQPAWGSTAGKATWRVVRPLAARSGGVFTAGVLWIFMPCSLLWSALLVAALSGGPLQGGLSMALFAIPSATGLLVGPALFPVIKRAAAARLGPEAGTRAAGLLLGAAATWALWMDLAERIALFCL